MKKETSIELAQAAGLIAKGKRLEMEGMALQREGIRVMVEDYKSTLANETGDKKYIIDGNQYEILEIDVEPDYWRGKFTEIGIDVTFILSDLDKKTYTGCTNSEKKILAELADIYKKLKENNLYQEERKVIIKHALNDLQGTAWRGLSSLKNKLKICSHLSWRWTIDDFIRMKHVGVALELGSKHFGDSMYLNKKNFVITSDKPFGV